jgi:hypothetical protein
LDGREPFELRVTATAHDRFASREKLEVVKNTPFDACSSFRAPTNCWIASRPTVSPGA